MISEAQRAICEEVKERLRRAERVVAFTGAGVSAESGIPTFRDHGGLWGNTRIEEVATPEAFRANPALVWNFYLERRKAALCAKPNAAHRAIASWEKQFPFAGVVTQNIDGLHAQAGSRRILELHGNLWKVRCLACGRIEDDDTLEYRELPSCERCGGWLRPHIVWFGESLEMDIVREAARWMNEADVIFAVGTSGVVEPAASFVRDAKLHGAFLVEVNVRETALSPIADISFFEKAGDVFSKWLAVEKTKGA